MINVQRIGTHDMPAPARQTAGAAGFDLQAAEAIRIRPYERELIKTGFAWEIPLGHVGIVKSRSSMACRGIHAQAGVIDADFRGEVRVLLENTSTEPVLIEQGQRIAQMVVVRHAVDEVFEVDELGTSQRGAGGFGSTGA